jgi:hypothetical protein
LITGSEDSLIYVYDVRTSSEPFVTYPTGSKTVHLVRSLPGGGGFVHAGLEEGSTYSVWEVVTEKLVDIAESGDMQTERDRERQDHRELGMIKRAFHSGMFFDMGPEDLTDDEGEEEEKDGAEDDEHCDQIRNQILLGLIEEVMQEHGDMFLKVFHKHNFTDSAHVDFQTLVRQIESASDSDSRDLLALMNEQLVKRLFQVMLDLQRDPRIVRDKYLAKRGGAGKGKEGRKEEGKDVVRH